MRRLFFPTAIASVVLATASGASALVPVAAGRGVASGVATVDQPTDQPTDQPIDQPTRAFDPVSVSRSVRSLSAPPVPVGGVPVPVGGAAEPITSPPGSTLAPPTTSTGSTASSEPAPVTKPAVRNLVITGHGYGHGRGLGQWGAYGYAVEKGWDYRRILDHYYGNTSPGKLSPTSAIGVRLLSQDSKPVAIYQGTGRLFITINGETFGPDAAALATAPTTELTTSGSPTPAKGPVAVGVPPATIPSGSDPSVPATPPPVTTAPSLLPPSGIAPGQPAVVRIQLVSTGRFVISEATSCAGPWAIRATVNASAVSVSAGGEAAEPSAMLQVCTSSGRRVYRGDLAAVDGKPNQYLVNQVNMEEYLRGVLPSEVPSGWGSKPNGMESLKAQAVAARSYAAAEKRPGLANTCDTTACQVYAGRGEFRAGSFVSFEDQRADDAIRATASEVRFDKSGAVVRTEFSSSTGGQTAPGAFPPVVDEGDRNAANPHVQWTVNLTAARLEAGRKLGAFRDIAITLRDGVGPYGGRVQNLDLVFERGRVSYKSGEFLRAYNLRSTLFNVQVVESGGSGGTGGTLPPLDTIPDDGTSGFVGVALPNQNKTLDTAPPTTQAAGTAAKLATAKTTVPARKKQGTVRSTATVVVTPVPVGKKAQQQIPVATTVPPQSSTRPKTKAKSTSAPTTKRK